MKETDIRKEERLSLKLVKFFRIYLKVIPVILALLNFINYIISYLGYECKIVAHGFVFLTISFIYVASYVLHFCEYHRICLHYVVIIYIINCVDYYIGIPISDFNIIALYFSITFIAIILIIYFKLKNI